MHLTLFDKETNLSLNVTECKKGAFFKKKKKKNGCWGTSNNY